MGAGVQLQLDSQSSAAAPSEGAVGHHRQHQQRHTVLAAAQLQLQPLSSEKRTADDSTMGKSPLHLQLHSAAGGNTMRGIVSNQTSTGSASPAPATLPVIGGGTASSMVSPLPPAEQQQQQQQQPQGPPPGLALIGMQLEVSVLEVHVPASVMGPHQLQLAPRVYMTVSHDRSGAPRRTAVVPSFFTAPAPSQVEVANRSVASSSSHTVSGSYGGSGSAFFASWGDTGAGATSSTLSGGDVLLMGAGVSPPAWLPSPQWIDAQVRKKRRMQRALHSARAARAATTAAASAAAAAAATAAAAAADSASSSSAQHADNINTAPLAEAHALPHAYTDEHLPRHVLLPSPPAPRLTLALFNRSPAAALRARTLESPSSSGSAYPHTGGSVDPLEAPRRGSSTLQLSTSAPSSSGGVTNASSSKLKLAGAAHAASFVSQLVSSSLQIEHEPRHQRGSGPTASTATSATSTTGGPTLASPPSSYTSSFLSSGAIDRDDECLAVRCEVPVPYAGMVFDRWFALQPARPTTRSDNTPDTASSASKSPAQLQPWSTGLDVDAEDMRDDAATAAAVAATTSVRHRHSHGAAAAAGGSDVPDLPRVRLRLRWVPLYAPRASGRIMHISLEVVGVGISLFDDQPREVLQVTVKGVSAAYDAHASSQAIALSVGHVQVDSQNQASVNPVVVVSKTASQIQLLRQHDPTSSSAPGTSTTSAPCEDAAMELRLVTRATANTSFTAIDEASISLAAFAVEADEILLTDLLRVLQALRWSRLALGGSGDEALALRETAEAIVEGARRSSTRAVLQVSTVAGQQQQQQQQLHPVGGGIDSGASLSSPSTLLQRIGVIDSGASRAELAALPSLWAVPIIAFHRAEGDARMYVSIYTCSYSTISASTIVDSTRILLLASRVRLSMARACSDKI